MAETEIDQGGPDELVESLNLILRVVASVLPACACALLVPDDNTLRVVARHGLDVALDPRIVDHLDRTLRDTALEDATVSFGVVPLVGSAPQLPFGAAVPLGRPDERELGVLVAFGDTPAGRFTPHQCRVLADCSRLAALQMSAAARAGAQLDRAEKTTRAMIDALEALPEAIAIFDDDHRFVFWNSRFEETYAGPGVTLAVGGRFEDHLRACLAAGHVIAARGREQQWLDERLARFHAANGAVEHQLGDGRWVRVQDRRLPHGGRVGMRADITDQVTRERSLRLLFDGNPAPMLVIDRETLRILAVNDAAVAFYGYGRPDFLNLSLTDIRPERHAGEIDANMARLGDSTLADQPRIHRTAAGLERIVRAEACALHFEGRPAVLAAIFDITERQRMQDEMQRARAFLRDVVDQVPAAVFVKDMWDDGRYVIYNRAGESLVARDGASLIGQTDREIFTLDAAERYSRQDHAALQGKGETVTEMLRLPDGSMRCVETRKIALRDSRENKPRYVLGVSEDITDRLANEARIAHMAHHDALTDLPNRFLLGDRLETALARLEALGELLALHYIDLDGFKAINDAWGHARGDALLCAVGERLRGALRVSDTVARLGGDEFVVVQTPMAQAGEAAWMAGRLLSILSKPYDFDGQVLRIGASIGIAVAPFDGMASPGLLAMADAALYQAKHGGRNRFRFADSSLAGQGGHDRSRIA